MPRNYPTRIAVASFRFELRATTPVRSIVIQKKKVGYLLSYLATYP